MRNLGKEGDAILDDQCKWAAFISHHEAIASLHVLWLSEITEKKLKEQGNGSSRAHIRRTMGGVF